MTDTFSESPAGQVELPTFPRCLQEAVRDTWSAFLRPEAPQRIHLQCSSRHYEYTWVRD